MAGFDPNDESRIDYQVRGVVDVPSPPYGDGERRYLAEVLLASAGLPQHISKFAILDWQAGDGGTGVHVQKCGPSPVLTNNDIFNLKTFTPPEVEETNDKDGFSSEQHNEWAREYSANRYCRYETRQELHQRYQDIWVNTQVLIPSGKIGLTTDKNWYRLQQHVITELQIRGQPPTRSNHHPGVQEAQPFFDGDLCRTAVDVVSAQDTDHDVLVKYGKRAHMESLFQKGELYLNSATSYNDSVHNQAVRDNELAIDFKGGYLRTMSPMQFYDMDQPPPKHVMNQGTAFRSIYNLPELGSKQYATAVVQFPTDYWMFCMAEVLDPRLFADFEADSCLLIKRKPFVERVLRMATLQLPNVQEYFDRIRYVDPLGAWPGSTRVTPFIPIHMTKVFRYAYQRESRFAFLPKRFEGRLEPTCIRIGTISDIAKLVPLPHPNCQGY